MAQEAVIKITADGTAVVTAAKNVNQALQGISTQADATASSLKGITQSSAGLNSSMQQLDKVGVSAKQTAAALRGVPAQFTDIVTSLQGGQQPLTVFLQQGGQLKDMFGGAGNAASALGGYVAGLVTPFTVAAAGIATLGYAMYRGAEQQRAFQGAMILSGNAAGATAGQIEKAYAAVAKATGQYSLSEDAIIGLVRGRQVAVSQLEAIAASVVRFSRAAGVDTKTLVEDFNAMGKEPVAAVLKLQEKYGLLTAATYQQVAALVEQGKKQDAVTLAQTQAGEAMDAIGRKAKENKGSIQAFIDAVKTASGQVFQGAMDLGKDQMPEATLAALRAELASRQARGPLNDTAGMAASHAIGLARLQAEIDKSQSLVTAQQGMAKSQADVAEVNERATAGIVKLNTGYDAHLNKAEQLTKQMRELKQARDDALKGPGVDAGEVNRKFESEAENLKRQLAPSFNMATLMHSLYLQESNNRQFNDNGSVVTNAKSGATGIAQIMPQFGADYARMAGVEWSAESLRTDPEYGKRLAEAGIKTYLKMFGNDVEKALAAYNWGPGNVKAAIGSLGDSWKTALPKETAGYLTGILGRMPKDRAGDFSDVMGSAPSSAFEAALVDSRKRLAQATAQADAAQRGLTKSQTEFEAVQASPVWATFNAGQKEGLTLLAQQEAVQDRLKQSADDGNKIKALADAQEAMNAAFGQSKIAAEQWKVAQLGANAAVAEALGQSPELVARLQKTTEEQQRYVAALKAADFKQTMEGLEEWKRAATEQAGLYADEAMLSGLTALERAKVVASRQVELRLAKELAVIEKKDWLSLADKEKAVGMANAAATIEKNAAVSKVIQDDWAKTADQINQSLTDALMRGFESGKGFAKNLRDTLVNMFKTLVLRPIISGVLTPVSNTLTSAVGLGGSGGGIMGAASNASTANTLYSVGSQALTGASVGASAASLGVANTVGALGGDALGALIVANGGYAGVAATSAAAGAQAAIAANVALAAGEGVALAAGTTAAAAAGGAAASAAPLAAMGPAGWIALAALAAFTIFSKNGGTPTSSTGDSQIRFDAAGNETSRLDLSTAAFAARSSAGADAIVRSIQAGYAGLASSLGVAITTSAFAYSGNTGEGGEKPSFALSGGAGNGYYSSGDVSANDANMQLQVARLMLASLQGSDLPKFLKGAFDGMAAGAMSQEQINGVLKSAQELKGFNDQLKALPFASLTDLSYKATAALIAASGGLQNLQSNLGAYYKDFYSAEEQRANTIKQINATTAGSGLDAATATRKSFRKIVESQDLTTASGQTTYAALLNVASAFAGITPVSQDAAVAVNKISDAMKRLQSDTATLQVELMRAQGNTAGANAAQYTIDTTGLSDAERAVFDYNAAIRGQITDLTAAKTAAEAAATANKTAAEAAATANKTAADNAFATLQRAVALEKTRIGVVRDAAAESVRSITSVFDLLGNQVRELYGTVASTAAMQAADGNAFIDAALASGGPVDAKQLGEAIAAARGGLNANEFATQFEADKAALVMAGKLSQLQATSGYQLTTAEQTLKTANDQLNKLDESLAFYQQQIDAMNGVNTSVLSVKDAIASLAAALLAQKAAVMTQSASAAAAGYVASLPADKSFNAAAATPMSERDQAVQAIYSSVLGRTADAGGLADFANSSLSIGEITASIQGSAEAAARAISVGYQNAFNSAVNASLGLTSTIKAFAAGGDHVGGLRIVGENGPELEATGPSRIFNAGQTRAMLSGAGNTERMENLIQGLTAEVQRLQGLMAEGNRNTERTAIATNGNPDRPVLVEIAT